MKRPTLYGIAACALMLAIVLPAAQSSAQQKPARPSPPGTAAFTLADGKTITINYSRPKMRDRKIYGGLVPYGEVWRAGANEATSFVTQSNLLVGGTTVPAGSYTLFILPQENGPWKLIVSKKTGEWGIPYPGEQNDLARINMKTAKTPAAVQDFTISFDKRGPNAGVIKFDWENTSASVDFSEASK
ncbi:MAG: DUF2911 domain-containing protein [Terriglobales bacterium]